jgi:hypothetical protein
MQEVIGFIVVIPKDGSYCCFTIYEGDCSCIFCYLNNESYPCDSEIGSHCSIEEALEIYLFTDEAKYIDMIEGLRLLELLENPPLDNDIPF